VDIMNGRSLFHKFLNVVLAILTACVAAITPRSNADVRAASYPILLVHGFEYSAFDPNVYWEDMAKSLTGLDPTTQGVMVYDPSYPTPTPDPSCPYPPSIWAALPAMKKLVGNGNVVYISNYTFMNFQPTSRNIATYSMNLAEEIQLIKNTEHVSQIDIVAHSMGGLVARCYIQATNVYKHDVRKLIMIGTPNNGTTWDTLAHVLKNTYSDQELLKITKYDSVLDMTKSTNLLSALNKPGNTGVKAGVQYSIIAGDCLAGVSDDVVNVSSVLLPEVPDDPSRCQILNLDHFMLAKATGPIVNDMLHDKAPSFLDILSATVLSPVELQVQDSQGRVTGVVNGQTLIQLPNSYYDDIGESVAVVLPTDSYQVSVKGKADGSYGLCVNNTTSNSSVCFSATSIPVSVGEVNLYSFDWAALSQGKPGVTVQIDSNGDGVYETTFTCGSQLTAQDFMKAVASAPVTLTTASTPAIPPSTTSVAATTMFTTTVAPVTTSATPVTLTTAVVPTLSTAPTSTSTTPPLMSTTIVETTTDHVNSWWLWATIVVVATAVILSIIVLRKRRAP
jgi:PGAP1-like protein